MFTVSLLNRSRAWRIRGTAGDHLRKFFVQYDRSYHPLRLCLSASAADFRLLWTNQLVVRHFEWIKDHGWRANHPLTG
jgi:hypothetical protein